MKTKWMIGFGAALMAIFMTACSTKYTVEELKASGTEINGVPFRINQQYKVELYQLGPEGYGEKPIAELTTILPNPEKLYVLKLRGGLFADSTASFGLHGDGTLKTVSVTSESKGSEVLETLGTQAKMITEAKEQKRIAEQELKQTALEAKQAVELARAELEEMDASATAIDRLKAEHKLETAELNLEQANQ